MPTRSSWGLPLVLSLLLHAAAVAGLWYWPMQGTSRVAGATFDVTMDFVEEALPSLEPAGTESTGPGEKLATPTPSLAGHVPTRHEPAQEPSQAGSSETQGSGSGDGGGVGVNGGGGRGTFFEIPTEGQRLVFLLDASASMGQRGAWTAAARELLHSVRRLGPKARFQIVVYNSTPQTLLPGSAWLGSTEPTLERIAHALATLPIEGRTDHLPALRYALALGPDVMFFLTDADDLSSEHLRQVQLLNRAQVVIHTIELSTANRHQPAMPLQLLARSQRGSYRAIDLDRSEAKTPGSEK